MEVAGLRVARAAGRRMRCGVGWDGAGCLFMFLYIPVCGRVWGYTDLCTHTKITPTKTQNAQHAALHGGRGPHDEEEHGFAARLRDCRGRRTPGAGAHARGGRGRGRGQGRGAAGM